MAQQEASPSPSAEVVGRAFVEQYYHILHESPGLVHGFYQDSSLLTRPDASGVVSTVTSMQAINEKILSLKYEDYTAEIETADAQESHERGVMVLVTGRLTGKNDINVRKKFSQTFFLAPQDKGYFVLNDVFRFLEETTPVAINGTTTSRDVQAPVEPVASIEQEDLDNVNVAELPTQISHNEVPSVAAPKHSYASIVKLMKSGPAPTTHVARNKPRPAAPISNNQKPTAATPAPDNGHSIYVRNLPYNSTPTQLGDIFNKFGPIKHEGIQVRSNKQGFCFGFVEFQTSNGRQNALQASPIMIADRQLFLEEKKTNTQGGRYFSGNESFKGGRGGGGGRGGEFSGRPKSSNPRNGGEGYKRVPQNGGGGRGGGRGGGGVGGSS